MDKGNRLRGDRGARASEQRPAGHKRRQGEARRRRVRQLTIATLAVVLAAVALAVAAVRTENDGKQPAGPASEAVFELERQPALGSPGAPVSVVEFADFKCPYCRQFTLEVFPRLEQEYIKTGKVRFYFINYPFIGPDSPTAAMAAEAVYAQDPEGVWRFIDAVMRRQGPETEIWATPEFLVDVAREAVPGIDADRLAADLRENRYRDVVERDRQIVERAGVRGTPAVFVNGKFVEDWSFEGLKAAIDEALAQAQGTGGGGSAGGTSR